MAGWILWVVAACGFAVGEMLTARLFLTPFALGGAAGAILDLSGAGELASWIGFVAVSLLTLAVLRPMARLRTRNPSQIRTGPAALVGKRAIVLERIANHEGVGCVKVDGGVWTARALDDEQVIERGTRVDVVDIKGATALVRE